MHNFVFRRLSQIRENYWFWPSAMTLCAVLLGFLLPALDAWLGTASIEMLGWMRSTQVDGARAILTTLAGATLGVAGVAFSVTIVAVSFASSNYGPRLIGNFMGDRTNQIVLGVFVATFVYCITVLSTVHARVELADETRDAFVPQLSVLFALILTLAAVGALIGYIHHIPESINIMNLAAKIGDKLQRRVITILDDAARRGRDEPTVAGVEPWRASPDDTETEIFTTRAGYIQQVDVESLVSLAREHRCHVTMQRGPGDFLAARETIMRVRSSRDAGGFEEDLRACYTQGANRTDVQDVLFLSDQLVEVLGRALSPGVNDPHTAMLCLDWLRAGLAEFARRPPPTMPRPDAPVLFTRVEFEQMLNRSFDRMRQYVAADRNVTLHALDVLAFLAREATRPSMAAACHQQMRRLAISSKEILRESAAHAEIEAALRRSLGVAISASG